MHEHLASRATPPARRPSRRLSRQPLATRRRPPVWPQEAPSRSQVRASFPEPRSSAAAMASNMDREMILADFQVKCLALLASHLQFGGFGVAARWPLPQRLCEHRNGCNVGFSTQRGSGCVYIVNHGEHVFHMLCFVGVCRTC